MKENSATRFNSDKELLAACFETLALLKSETDWLEEQRLAGEGKEQVEERCGEYMRRLDQLSPWVNVIGQKYLKSCHDELRRTLDVVHIQIRQLRSEIQRGDRSRHDSEVDARTFIRSALERTEAHLQTVVLPDPPRRVLVRKKGLNLEKVTFLAKQILSAESSAFPGTVGQLFNYLGEVAGDNAQYVRLEEERKRWTNWPESTVNSIPVRWGMPADFEDAKSLAYSLYRSCAGDERAIGNLTLNLFGSGSFDINVSKFNSTFGDYFVKAIEDILGADDALEMPEPASTAGTKVFIVHGHDESLKREVQLLLTRAELEEVVLHERPDKGRTLIDKLIEEGKDAGYVVALLSPDDELADGTARARQNVILEVGYFLGLLGKSKVRLLKKGNIEIPSDLYGILYESFDDKGAWKMRLLKEIQESGLTVNIDSALRKL